METITSRQVRKVVMTALGGKVTVRKQKPSAEVLEKKLFIQCIEILKQIEDESQFAVEELGIDLTTYEEKFLIVINNLFSLHFNKEQHTLIMYYVYQAPSNEEFDGTVSIEVHNKKEKYPLKTSEDLWKIVNKLG